MSSPEDGLELKSRAILALLNPLVSKCLVKQFSIGPFVTEPIRLLFVNSPYTIVDLRQLSEIYQPMRAATRWLFILISLAS